MTNFFLSSSGCYGWPVIKQIIWVFGYAIKYLYNFLEAVGIENLAVCILLFTLIVKLVLLPLTIRQQRFTKLTSIMQPELNAIQNKYKNARNDQNAAMAMQTEMKAVYAKYGTSQMGGCLQSFIQMPILIAFYGVIREAANYIDTLRGYFEQIIVVLNGASAAVTEKLAEISSYIGGGQDAETQITALYTMSLKSRDAMMQLFSGADLSTIQSSYIRIDSINNFLGIDMSQTPWSQMLAGGIGIIAVLIPIIAGIGQWLSFKLTQSSSQEANQMQGSMKYMGIFMPLISVYFCFTLQAGLGIYWAISALFQVVLQVLINRHYRTIDMDAFVKENMEKAALKAKKKEQKLLESGHTSGSISSAAGSVKRAYDEGAARKASKGQVSGISAAANANLNTKSASGKSANQPPAGSLAAKAALVQSLGFENDDHSERKKYKK